MPHIRKQEKGGEDAYFLAVDKRGAACGVADGVGGWARENIDPQKYPKVGFQI